MTAEVTIRVRESIIDPWGMPVGNPHDDPPVVLFMAKDIHLALRQGRVGPGDLVTYTDDELVHATCSTDPSTEQAQPVTYARLEAAGGTDAVCRSCWTIHAGECL